MRLDIRFQEHGVAFGYYVLDYRCAVCPADGNRVPALQGSAVLAAHTVRVTKADGTVEERHFTLDDGAVMLDPDLRVRFPDSESVNKALRCLIPLLPKKQKAL